MKTNTIANLRSIQEFPKTWIAIAADRIVDAAPKKTPRRITAALYHRAGFTPRQISKLFGRYDCGTIGRFIKEGERDLRASERLARLKAGL